MNDIPGGVCDYCNADEGRCWDDCPTVKIEQQANEIKRLREALQEIACDCDHCCNENGLGCDNWIAFSALQQKDGE